MLCSSPCEEARDDPLSPVLTSDQQSVPDLHQPHQHPQHSSPDHSPNLTPDSAGNPTPNYCEVQVTKLVMTSAGQQSTISRSFWSKKVESGQKEVWKIV